MKGDHGKKRGKRVANYFSEKRGVLCARGEGGVGVDYIKQDMVVKDNEKKLKYIVMHSHLKGDLKYKKPACDRV